MRFLSRLLVSLAVAGWCQPARASVPSTDSYVDATANGATHVFTFTFAVTTSSSHVEVYLNESKQAVGYVVALNLNQTSSPGGTVTFLANGLPNPPANGVRVRIQRMVPLTQETVLSAYSPYRAKDVEKALDRVAYQTQQLDRYAKVNQAARDNAQDLALAQGAVGGSDTFITATGSTTARKLKDRAADLLNAKDFGAVLDGVADDTAAVQAALDQVPAAGGTVIVPRGHVKLTSTLTISRAGTLLLLGAGTYTSTANPVLSITAGNVTVRGAGYFATQVYVNSATNDGISVNGGVPGISGVAIEDMAIPCHSGANTGYAVHLVKVGNWRLRGLYIRDPWIGIAIDNSNTGFASDITIDTTLAAQSLYDGVEIVNTSVSNHFARVLVTSSATAIRAGFYVGRETDTASFVDCGVQASGAAGGAYGWTFALDGGSYAPRWIKILGAYVEVAKTTGIGFQLDHVKDVEVTDAYSLWGLYNFHVTPNAKAVKIRGGTAQLAYQYGVLIEGGNDVELNGLTVSDASQQANTTYDGVAIAGGDGVRLLSVRSGNHIWAGASPASATNFQRYGILTTGAVDNYSIIGCDTRNALGTGGISDAATGTNKQVFGNRTNSGLGTAFPSATTISRLLLPASADRGDTSQTLTVGTDAQVQRWATTLTANRTVTCSTTGAANGDSFRVVRTGLGAFTLDVCGLRTVPSATAAFVEVSYDGSAWRLVGYGAL